MARSKDPRSVCSQGQSAVQSPPEINFPLPNSKALSAIVSTVQKLTGHDLSSYKKSTLERRVARRMSAHDLESMESYLALLKKSPEEADALCREMLIGVTAFFRDPEAFESLRDQVIPRLFDGRDPKEPVRIWLACCSSGEEVYSLAMLIREYLSEQKLSLNVLIFATDIDDSAVARARAGCYSEEACRGLSEERLASFFTKVAQGFQVSKSLREMIVFARHDLLQDPPFSRLDLLVCRNFLIYITPDMQKQLIPLFHRVLRPEGFLFLGNSETIGSHNGLFSALDKKWKIFKRSPGVYRPASGHSLVASLAFPERTGALTGSSRPEAESPGEMVERLLMDRYSPPCVIVNENYEVVHISSRTGRFLEMPLGEPTRNILKMVQARLRPVLRTAIHKAFSEQRAVVFRGQMAHEEASASAVDMLVEPLGGVHASRRLAMVVFEPAAHTAPVACAPEPSAHPTPQGEAAKDLLISQLETQLQIHHEQLHVTIEQLESSNLGLVSSNEALMGMNEELQATNEELQATNEELETSKEELQSLNEELVTVNVELHDKMEELNRAHNDVENFLHSTEIATVFLDLELRVRRFTPIMAHLFNLIPADVGHPFRHFSGRFDWPEITRDVEGVLEGKGGVEREANDQVSGRHYLLRVLPYRTSAGAIDGVVLALVDITESKRAAQSLIESEKRYRSLFEHLQDGFALCKMLYDESGNPADFVYLSVNAAFLQMSGLEDVVGKRVSEALPGYSDGSPELLETYGRVARTGCSERFVIHSKPLNKWLSISAYSLEPGYFVSVIDNITERKEAEQRLLEYRKIIECTRDMVYVLDRERRYVLANESYLRYRGVRLDELVGTPLGEVVSIGSFIEITPHLDSCFEGREESYEDRCEYPGMGERDISVTYTPILDGTEVQRVACIIKDITEQKQLEEQLRQSQKMEAVGTLAGGIAHDFNNILTVIAGCANLIQLKEDQVGAVSPLAQEILTSVERATEMTRRLLAFSRKQPANLSGVDLNEIVLSLNKSLSRLISEDIELVISLTEAPLSAVADRGQLEQVLINLVVNARDAMLSGGTLVIATEEAEVGENEAGLELGLLPGRYGVLTVSDNGSGIDRRIQERVFEPFFTTKQVGKGTGLGLSMVYGIIKNHNGAIKMQSEPGEGTSFRIFLPLTDRPPKNEDLDGACLWATGSETILLVEDCAAIRNVTGQLLEEHGYRVLTAGNGEEALEIFQGAAEQIELLITDLVMPRMNGRELHQEICRLSPQLPTIFMSGYTANIIEEKGSLDERVSLLFKPIKLETLLRKIRDVLTGALVLDNPVS